MESRNIFHHSYFYIFWRHNMSKEEKELKVKKFAEDLDYSLYELKRLLKFIDLGNQSSKDDIKDGIKLLKKKVQKIKKSKSLKESSKYVKVKKINKIYVLRGDGKIEPK